MVKITKDDLQRRSKLELTALFNHIHRGVGWLPRQSSKHATALAALAMIRAEQTRRGLDP